MVRRSWLFAVPLVAAALWWLLARPPAVVVGAPRETSYQSEVAFTGILVASKTAVDSPLAGVLQSLPVQVGSPVRAGQVVAVVEDSAMAARSRALQADLRSALSRVDSLSADLAAAREQLRQAEAAVEAGQAEIEALRAQHRQSRRERRQQDSAETGAVPGSEVGAAEAPAAGESPRAGRRRPGGRPREAAGQTPEPSGTPGGPEALRRFMRGNEGRVRPNRPRRQGEDGEGRDGAAPEVQAARDRVQASRQQARDLEKRIEDLESRLQAAQAEAERPQGLLQGLRPRAALLAPRDGTVTGILLSKGDSVAKDAPVVEVTAMEPLHVQLKDARLAAALAPGQGARVRLEGRVLPAKVALAADGVLAVEVPDREGRLEPGLKVEVDLGTCTFRGLAVPSAAVAEGAVWVVEDGRAVRRPVKSGPAQDREVVVEEGLAPGDQVVLQGGEDLHPGQAVRTVSR